MSNTTLLLVAGGGVAAWYFFFRKKPAPVPVAPIAAQPTTDADRALSFFTSLNQAAGSITGAILANQQVDSQGGQAPATYADDGYGYY